MGSKLWAGLLVLFVGLGWAPPARADPAIAAIAVEPSEPTRLPVAQARHPLTLPENVANAVVGFSRMHWPAGVFLNANVGAGFGVTDDLTVRAQLVPLQLSSPRGFGGLHYGQTSEAGGPSASATFRFLRGDVAMGASIDVRLLTVPNTSGFVVTPGLPLRVHLTRALRLDVSPSFRMESKIVGTRSGFGSVGRTETEVGPVVPVGLLYNISDPFHVGVSSGFAILDLHDVRNTARIPAGAAMGWTIRGERRSAVDISASLGFPNLVLPGASSTTRWDWYVVGVEVSGYFFCAD